MANIFRPSTWLRPGDNRPGGKSAADGPTHEPTPRAGAAPTVDGDWDSRSTPIDESVDSAASGARVDAASPLTDVGPIQDQIALRAYFKWRDDGCPVGRDLEYWLQAEAEVLEESLRRGGG